MNDELTSRYQRQVLLKEIGPEGQLKLHHAKVLVVGAGGLGCPALLYLASAGIGTIGIVDSDSVELTNLHRQVLFAPSDIGRNKAEVAVEKLQVLNDGIELFSYPVEMNNKNAFQIISLYDLVIDGTDNFAIRYAINDLCSLLNKPLVYGSVFKFEGQVSLFNVSDKNGIKTQYRDLFPLPPSGSEIPSCNEIGAFGPLTGIIGLMQATEAIKWFTGTGIALANKLFTYNTLNNLTQTLEIKHKDTSPALVPATLEEYESMDYVALCTTLSLSFEIESATLDQLLKREEVVVIDVREPNEKPPFFHPHVIHLSSEKLMAHLDLLTDNKSMVVICQSGVRSRKAAQMLMDHWPEKEIYSLRGGINSWTKFNTKEKDG